MPFDIKFEGKKNFTGNSFSHDKRPKRDGRDAKYLFRSEAQPRSVYTEARDNYRVFGTAGWHYKLVPVPGQCGLTESRISAWQQARQKDETSKKDQLESKKKEERGGEWQSRKKAR